jgi:hypothetical protein
MSIDTTTILLSKTDINAISDAITRLLNHADAVLRWSLDPVGKDCVLKIVSENMSVQPIMEAISSQGHHCVRLD